MRTTLLVQFLLSVVLIAYIFAVQANLVVQVEPNILSEGRAHN